LDEIAEKPFVSFRGGSDHVSFGFVSLIAALFRASVRIGSRRHFDDFGNSLPFARTVAGAPQQLNHVNKHIVCIDHSGICD
jgi:hypothetical protein